MVVRSDQMDLNWDISKKKFSTGFSEHKIRLTSGGFRRERFFRLQNILGSQGFDHFFKANFKKKSFLFYI